MRLLIVEDDLVIAKAIADRFETYGFAVQVAEQFDDIMAEFNLFLPDIVILDVNLPLYNGYHWCQTIRAQSKVPIVFLSSITENMDMMLAMQLGADDYVTKPIDLEVLVTKIQAILRRTYDYTVIQTTFSYDGILLNPDAATLTYKGESVYLTHTEIQMIKILIQQAGSYVSRDEILDLCWKNDQFIDDNTLAVNMSRIRKKLNSIQLHDIIQTKKKVGYRMKKEGEVSDEGL